MMHFVLGLCLGIIIFFTFNIYTKNDIFEYISELLEKEEDTIRRLRNRQEEVSKDIRNSIQREIDIHSRAIEIIKQILYKF